MTREELAVLEAMYETEGCVFARNTERSFPQVRGSQSAFCSLLYSALLTAAAEQPDKLNTFEAFTAAFNIDEQHKLFPLLKSNAFVFELLNGAEQFLGGSEKLLKSCLLFHQTDAHRAEIKNSAQQCVNRVIAKLLAPEKGGMVVNLSAGCGGFIRDCYSVYGNEISYGISENEDDYYVALIRAELLGINTEHFNRNKVLENEGKYKRLFVNYPFAARLGEIPERYSKAKAFAAYNKEFSALRCADWFYAGYAAELLDFGGRAALVMPASALIRSGSDDAARKNLIENGKIEAVIEITGCRFYANTSVKTAIVVLGKAKSSVRFVRAELPEDCALRLNEQQIDDIASAFGQDGTFGCAKSISKGIGELLAVNSAKQCEGVRLQTAPVFYPQSGKKLGSCLQTAFRTRLFSGKSLEKYFTEKETQIKYLELSNLSDGGISGRIQCLESLPEKSAELGIPDLAANLLREGDLLVSRIGNPNFRFAAAEFGADKPFQKGDAVIPSSNLFVLRFTDDVNVWFVKAYLESDEGQKQMMNLFGNGHLNLLSIDALKSCIFIPDAGRVRQDETAEEYRRLRGELKALSEAADKKSKELKNFCDNIANIQKQ